MRASVLRDGRMVYRDDVPDPVPESGSGASRCASVWNLRLRPTFRRSRSQGGGADRADDGRCRGTGGMDIDLNRDVFMGHEFSAEILEAGPDTETHPPGTLVTSIPVLLSAKGFEPIVYSNSTIGGYAERMLLSAPLLVPIPNGLDFKTCRPDRTHGGRVARRQQVEHSAGRDRPGAWLRSRSASPLSRRFGYAGSKPLWHRTFRRSDASSLP